MIDSKRKSHGYGGQWINGGGMGSDSKYGDGGRTTTFGGGRIGYSNGDGYSYSLWGYE